MTLDTSRDGSVFTAEDDSSTTEASAAEDAFGSHIQTVEEEQERQTERTADSAEMESKAVCGDTAYTATVKKK